ncbi:MAG: helix-turn-helix domain-containing protein [Lentisphaeria bacterium]|nr:helix-turn-helix domain-containing protein [Lentisphaeria bacterium]
MDFTEIRTKPVRLCYWGYAEGGPDIRLAAHEHDFWQAQFTLSGCCTMRTDNGVFNLHDHDLIFLAPGVKHSLTYPEPYLCFTCKFHAGLPDPRRIFHLPASDFTRGVIQAAKVILETTFPSRFFGVPEGTVILPSDHYQTLMEHFLTGVLAVLMQKQQERTGILDRLYREQEKRGRPFFSVAEAAEACGYSRNHFSLLIRQQTGSSAKDYLNRIRLENARQFLRYSDLSLAEIGSVLGFSSQFHFSDFFKRMSGISPLRCRKEKSGKNG